MTHVLVIDFREMWWREREALSGVLVLVRSGSSGTFAEGAITRTLGARAQILLGPLRGLTLA